MTDLLDEVVLLLLESALAALDEDGPEGPRPRLALVGHGGFGRRDVAPYSDVDLMVLYERRDEERVERLARRLLGDLFDAGVDLAQSVRTVRQAYQAALDDPVVLTSLAESRLLAGSQALFDQFWQGYVNLAKRQRRKQLARIEEARDAERAQYGETIYLLEPNVKRSRGGLRDIHFLRWLGFVTQGVTNPADLELRGAISKDDLRILSEAGDFLLRLRNEMHFHAGQAHDQLDRAEQLRLAEQWQYPGADGLLPVEQFMRDYFRHTRAASAIATRFLQRSQPGSRWKQIVEPLISHQVEGDFRVGRQIAATRRGLRKLAADAGEILRLADLANLYDAPIDPATCEAIREAAHRLPDELSEAAAGRFLSLLGQPLRLGEMLRLLHDVHVLEKIIPGFDHARCLLQFNEYHQFTVDEHCLRAVEAATDLQDHPGALGRAYRGLKRKDLLHLALLIHDLGKGYSEDHSEVGRRLARESAERLRLSAHDAETLEFLVHKHLMMSHMAFRRDTSDELQVLQFAHDVGSPERLQMLYVLTAADLTAVKPGVFNPWKAEVLTSLFNRTLWHLAGDQGALTPQDRLVQLRTGVLSQLGEVEDRAWYEEQVAALPLAYYEVHPAAEIAAELKKLHSLAPDDVIAAGQFNADRGAVQYTVATHESIVPGVFHRLTGALTGQGLSILTADIYTLARGLIIDRFEVQDPDHEGAPPPERIEAACQALRQSLLCPSEGPPKFRKLWQARRGKRPSELAPLPTRVVIDNATSSRYTVIDVFAHDRLGLLYTITRALFELGLSVSVAKIGTYLDQVVDVFYVTDVAGGKIEDPQRLDAIRDRLHTRIAALEQEQS
jgi:[protein-PII] uridylyltransferase